MPEILREAGYARCVRASGMSDLPRGRARGSGASSKPLRFAARHDLTLASYGARRMTREISGSATASH